MIQATQLRRGNTILMNGELYQVVDYQHITPGNWRGMVQTKLRKLSTGAIIDHRFRSEDRVERAVLDEREMEYLYKEDRKSTRLNSSHSQISYAVFCLKKKKS